MANLYVRVGGGGGIECGAAHKTGARETRESEAGGVHTGPQNMAAASPPYVPSCPLYIYTQNF